MTVTVLRTNFRDALLTAERFIGKHVSLPVVGNVLIKSENQKIKIQATNLEVGVEITLPVKTIKEGVVTVPPKILSSLLQTIPEEKVTLSERQNTLFITTETIKSEIRGIPASEFPIMPSINKKPQLTVQNSQFISQLSRVLPTVSFSDFKPEISGVLFKISKREFFLVGTDTFRLAEAKIKAFQSTEEGIYTLPLRPLQELVRIAGLDDEISFTFHEGQVVIETGDVKIISRLISGRYPEYENIIPHDFPTLLHVPRETVLQNARLSGVFSSKLNDILLSYKTNHLMLEITNNEVGKYTYETPIKTTGKPGKIAFNYRYLADSLEALKDKEIVVAITDETHPTKIYEERDPSFFTILMPIRF